MPGLLLPLQTWDEALEAGAGARFLCVPQFHPCVVGFAFEAAITHQAQNLEQRKRMTVTQRKAVNALIAPGWEAFGADAASREQGSAVPTRFPVSKMLRRGDILGLGEL